MFIFIIIDKSIAILPSIAATAANSAEAKNTSAPLPNWFGKYTERLTQSQFSCKTPLNDAYLHNTSHQNHSDSGSYVWMLLIMMTTCMMMAMMMEVWCWWYIMVMMIDDDDYGSSYTVGMYTLVPKRFGKLRVDVDTTVLLSATLAWLPIHREQPGISVLAPTLP